MIGTSVPIFFMEFPSFYSPPPRRLHRCRHQLHHDVRFRGERVEEPRYWSQRRSHCMQTYWVFLCHPSAMLAFFFFFCFINIPIKSLPPPPSLSLFIWSFRLFGSGLVSLRQYSSSKFPSFYPQDIIYDDSSENLYVFGASLNRAGSVLCRYVCRWEGEGGDITLGRIDLGFSSP